MRQHRPPVFATEERRLFALRYDIETYDDNGFVLYQWDRATRTVTWLDTGDCPLIYDPNEWFPRHEL